MRRGLRSAVAPSGLSSTLVRFAHPSGKKAPIAHFDGGARNVARNGVGQLTHTGGARSCSPFSAVKMGGPFSLRCLSPPCPGAVGGGHTQPLQGGMLWRSLCFFRKAKGRREIKSTLAFSASHEARRRMAAFSVQRTKNHIRPASREACRRAAVIPQPSRMSLYAPARRRRAVRGQGALPLVLMKFSENF